MVHTTHSTAEPHRRWLIALLALGILGCAGKGSAYLGPLEIDVIYHGSTADRPIEAFILHTEVDNYNEANNLLFAPLELDDATRLTDIPYGEWYITVIRKQRPLPDSPRVAMTTADPVTLHSGRHEILIFDDFFRVMDPVSSEDATP